MREAKLMTHQKYTGSILSGNLLFQLQAGYKQIPQQHRLQCPKTL